MPVPYPEPDPDSDRSGLKPTGPLWLRLPAETDQQYAAFLAYRDMPRPRSLRDLRAGGLTDASEGSVRNWSRDHQWQVRCEAWDAQVETARDAARIQAYGEEAAKWEQRKLADAEDAWQMKERLRSHIETMLKVPPVRKSVKGRCRCGEPNMTVFEPVRWTFASMTRAAQIVVQLGEAARLTAEDSELDRFDPETASPEECAAVLAREKAKRAAYRRVQPDAGPDQ